MRTSGPITQQDVEKIVAASTKVLSDKIKELEAQLAQVTEERDTWNEYAFEATKSEHRYRETIRCLVVAFRVVWRVLVGVGVLHGVSPKRLIAEVKFGIRLVENTLSEQFLIDIDRQLRAERAKE